MDGTHIGNLPDELLEAIVYHLPPLDTVAFGNVCLRANKITHEPLVWRRHCLRKWRYWSPRHELEEKKQQPPAQVKWQQMFRQRSKADEDALVTFDALLLTQQYRMKRIEQLASAGFDVLDLLLKLDRQTPSDAPDVLARTYHARLIRSRIYREVAITKWVKLQQRGMVLIEDALGAFDLLATGGESGSLEDLRARLDDLAERVRNSDSRFDDLSTREKAVRVAQLLHTERMLGTDGYGGYHNLRNNFIIRAVLDEPHRSLPLQSAAIYCAVARRLDVDARPSNFPSHVYVVVQAPPGRTCDGRPFENDDEQRDVMHMDPWRHDAEVETSALSTQLTQMGAPAAAHAHSLGPATTFEIALRCTRNIMTSVTDARNRQRQANYSAEDDEVVSAHGAYYSMLWASILLINNIPQQDATTRRAAWLPHLVDVQQQQFSEDIGLLERHVVPSLVNTPEYDAMLQLITANRWSDDNKKAPSHRSGATTNVRYRIGHHFLHKRYAYTGAIVGWDAQCEAGDQWIQQMRVNDLPLGRRQPFYNVLADDGSVRYVAQENIELMADQHPSAALLSIAGKYFKRFDQESMTFVSNITEEYPDD